MVLVTRRMYAFHASEPASRPPPVSFSPPNAPPISAPDGPMLAFAMPQSEPAMETNFSISCMSVEKIDEERPCRTRSEEHTSELQSLAYLVCRLLLEKK